MPTGIYLRKSRGVYKPEMLNRPIKCESCGIEVMAMRKTKRFCSDFCAHKKRYVPRGRKKGKFVPCSFCGKDAWTPPSRAKTYKIRYCNKDCMIAAMKSKSFNFPCAICGKKVFTQPAQLKYRARSTCSKECRFKLARQKAESRRVGYTKHQLDRLARYSVETKEWRKKVFERDDYTCQICGVRGTYLEADHIKPFAYFPELRYELSNGRTLCRKCHDKTKMSAKRMREIYGIKNTV